MLNDLSGNLTHGKSKDLIGRLNQKNDPAQLIGAEMELALVWAIQRRARLEIEPNIDNSQRKPDAFLDCLVRQYRTPPACSSSPI